MAITLQHHPTVSVDCVGGDTVVCVVSNVSDDLALL